ncbi:unnamed protein product, partial [Acanthocheilonema viteae]
MKNARFTPTENVLAEQGNKYDAFVELAYSELMEYRYFTFPIFNVTDPTLSTDFVDSACPSAPVVVGPPGQPGRDGR